MPQGVSLTPSKPVKVTTAGAVVDGRAVDGSITVLANNVTIKRTRVVNDGYYAIRIAAGVTGTIIEDVDIVCAYSKGNGVGFAGYTARRVRVTSCKNAFLGSSTVGVRVEASMWNDIPMGSQSTTSSTPTTNKPTTTSTINKPTTPTTAKPPVSPPVGVPTAFPSDATTGYKSCGLSASQLKPMSGNVELRSGQVLENFDLAGAISVTGSNVTIRCGRIRSSGAYAVSATRSGSESFLVDRVEMIGLGVEGQNNASTSVAPYGIYTLSKVNVHGFRDGVKLGSNQTVEDSWVHDLWRTAGSHNDGMQSVGGRNVKILRNNIEGPWVQSTSALILGTGGGGVLEDYVIEGNRLSGGTYTVYIGGPDGDAAPQRIKVRNNVFVNGSFVYGPLSTRLGWPATDSGHEWSGNVFSDGTAFNR